tara:strand:+ start:174 stop:803 length:630 start_codon:yes stop_codon:yes gene_type:complete
MTYIRKATPEDIFYVSQRMREDDCKEIEVSTNTTPANSLIRGYKLSEPSCYSIVNDMFPRESREEDIKEISPRLRQADLDEIEALGEEPEEALRLSYFGSKPRCYTALHQDTPMAMFGVVPFPENPKWGSIWLLGTDDVTDVAPISFLKWTKLFLPELIEPYEMVCNIVHKNNTAHIKWIKWLGFSFIRELTAGPQNQTFYEFARLNHV